MTKRRTRGEGGVRQRRDGRWQGAIDLGWQGGKRRRKYVTQRNGETKQSFLARFRRERAAIEAGRPAVDERIRVGDFLDRWLVEVVKRETGQSPRGVQYIHAVPRAALATAMRWELVGRNVATLVEPISVRRKEVVPFDPEEVRVLLDAASSDRLGALYTVALAVGLRPCEALALSWGDLDLEAGEPRVRHGLRREEWESSFFVSRSRETHGRSTALCSPHDAGPPSTAATSLATSAAFRRGLAFPTTGSTTLVTLPRAFSSPKACSRGSSWISSAFAYQLTMDTYTHVMPVLTRDAAEGMGKWMETR